MDDFEEPKAHPCGVLEMTTMAHVNICIEAAKRTEAAFEAERLDIELIRKATVGACEEVRERAERTIAEIEGGGRRYNEADGYASRGFKLTDGGLVPYEPRKRAA